MKSCYKLSIITPLHKVYIPIFNRTFGSLKAQAFGFPDIEWLVTVHNSSPEYCSRIEGLLSGYDNIRILTLNDTHHTPSSPRNYALEHATGEYVGFLDGDDKYTPDCLKVALRNIELTGADICCFRREIELETASHLVLNEKVLWDQTQERIVVNKDTWDDKKIFNVIWGMVTSKIYRRSFLNEHNLRFDENILFAEDFALNVKAYGLAKNICLLPQLIGYVYYINSASLVQAVNLPDEKLIAYAQGFKKIFDTGLNYGFNMNDVMHNLLTHEAALILSSKTITSETRSKIREILAPYVRMLTPLAASKLYTDQRRQELMTFPQVILSEGELKPGSFIAYRRQPAPVTVQDYQALALKNILEHGERSDYGQRYQFDSIMTMEGYSSRLPLTNYDTYSPMINLAARIQESGIFTNDDICAYSIKYGKLGTPRRLPFTSKHLNYYIEAFRKQIGSDRVFLLFESLPYHSSGLDLDDTYTNTLMGLILSEIYKQGITRLSDRLNISNLPALLFPDEMLNAEYVRLFFALRDKNIEAIYAPDAWTMWQNFELMFEQWDNLCDDIEAGHIRELDKFPEDLRNILNSRITPDKSRAGELRRIYLDNKVREIWPRLKKFICACSGSYKIYADNFRKHIDGVELCNTSLALDEALIAHPLNNDDSDIYELDLNSGFYEFMNDNRIYYAHQLEPGKAYNVIISNFAGLYRYKIDINIIPVSVSAKSVTFRLDDGYEAKIYEAVKSCSQRSGLEYRDFVYFQDDNGEYNLLLEPLYEVIPTREDLESLSGVASDMLAQAVSVKYNEPKTHALYREIQQYRRKVLPDAIRPVHVTDNPAAIKFFKRMII